MLTWKCLAVRCSSDLSSSNCRTHSRGALGLCLDCARSARGALGSQRPKSLSMLCLARLDSGPSHSMLCLARLEGRHSRTQTSWNKVWSIYIQDDSCPCSEIGLPHNTRDRRCRCPISQNGMLHDTHDLTHDQMLMPGRSSVKSRQLLSKPCTKKYKCAHGCTHARTRRHTSKTLAQHTRRYDPLAWQGCACPPNKSGSRAWRSVSCSPHQTHHS